MTDPFSAAAAGGTSLLSGLANLESTRRTNRTNLQIAREQNAFNERMMDKQNDWNLEQWERNNSYNTPAAQMQRFRDAGINPYFALGNVQGGNAQSLTSAGAAPAAGATMEKPDYSFVGQAFNNGLQAYLNMKQGKLMDESLKTQQIDNLYRSQRLMSDIEETKARTKSLQVKSYGDILQNAIVDRTQQDIINMRREESKQAVLRTVAMTAQNESIKISNDLAKFQRDKLNPKQAKVLDAQYRNILADTTVKFINANNQTQLTKAQCELIGKQVFKTLAETKGLEFLNGVNVETRNNLVSKIISDSMRSSEELQKLRYENEDKFWDRGADIAYPLTRGIAGPFKNLMDIFRVVVK